MICIQESRLSKTTDLSLVQIDEYNSFYREKKNECRNPGGLITYVDDNFLFGNIYFHESKELVILDM